MNTFHWRRIPGTVALATTNFIAGLLIFNKGAFESHLVTSAAAGVAPGGFYSTLFFLSAFTLLLATILRNWPLLNIGSGISLFVWTFICVSIFIAWASGTVTLTPLALALFFWMVIGQATMLFVPLIARGRGTE